MFQGVTKAGKALLVALASVLVPALASASIARGPETRVWGFDLGNAPLVGLEGSEAADWRRAYELGYGGSASDSTVARSIAAKARVIHVRDLCTLPKVAPGTDTVVLGSYKMQHG